MNMETLFNRREPGLELITDCVQEYLVKIGTMTKPLWPERVIAEPNPHDLWVIQQAQSILTANGEIGPLLPVEQAQDIVNWASRGGVL